MGELMAKHMWNERSKEVAADTKKYIEQIAARYKSAYTYCILQQLRKNLSSRNEQTLLLEQRKWHTYNRPLQSGYLYVLGTTEHRKWRRRFCVLQSDYTLEVYDTEEDFEVANHPRYCRKFCNFTVIDNVDAHFVELVKDYLRDFGFVRENVSHLIKKLGLPSDTSKRPTQHVLALYHHHRGRFYMAADSAVEKDKWMKSMQDAERQLSGVHCETQIQRDAFKFAIQQACDAEEHCGITVNMSGTQEEITSEFIVDYLSNGCKTMLQTKVSGDACKKFKMWEAISKTLTLSVENIVKAEYPPLRKKAEEEAEQLKQRMLLSMPQINTVYETASVEILAVLDCNFKEDLNLKILPKIPELVTRMGELLSVPLREVRDLFTSLAESVLRQSTTTSTEFANNIDRFFVDHLDLAPRNPEVMHIIFQAAIGKKSPLSMLSETFPKLNYSEQETKLCLLLQTVLDSAICTFESLCGEVVQKNEGHLKPMNVTKIQGRVLKKLDHDNIVLTKQFLKELAAKITYDVLQHIIRYDARNKLRDHEDLIPSEWKEFLPIANVFRDSVLENIEEELQPSISAAFKRLAKDHFRISRYHSNSTINSHSSNVSDETNSTPKHESLSKQASSSDSSPIQKSAPVVEELQEIGNIAAADKKTNDEDIPVDEVVCMDGETGEPCDLVDEYGEPLPAPKKKNEQEVSLDAKTKGNNEETMVSEDAVNTHQEEVEDQDVVEEVLLNKVPRGEQSPEKNEDKNFNADEVESLTNEGDTVCVIEDAVALNKVAEDELKAEEIEVEHPDVEGVESLTSEEDINCVVGATQEGNAHQEQQGENNEETLIKLEDDTSDLEGENGDSTVKSDENLTHRNGIHEDFPAECQIHDDLSQESQSDLTPKNHVSGEPVNDAPEQSQAGNDDCLHETKDQTNVECHFETRTQNAEIVEICPSAGEQDDDNGVKGESEEEVSDSREKVKYDEDDISPHETQSVEVQQIEPSIGKQNGDSSTKEEGCNEKIPESEEEKHDGNVNYSHESETSNADIVHIVESIGKQEEDSNFNKESSEEEVGDFQEHETHDNDVQEENNTSGVLPSSKVESVEAEFDNSSNEEERAVGGCSKGSDEGNVTVPFLKRGEQHQNEENIMHQANGKINQNGVSKMSSDVDGDTPSVPARRKKHPAEDKNEQARSTAEEKSEISACTINDDIEYNGVIEQIIHTGEEKLI